MLGRLVSKLFGVAVCCAALGATGSALAQQPGAWGVAGTLLEARATPGVVALDAERVLVCGGTDATRQPLRSCEVWNVTTGISISAPALGELRQRPTLARLADGSVLLVARATSQDRLTGLERLDAQGWHPATPLARASAESRVLPLRDGRALVYGYSTSDETCASALIWDPRDERVVAFKPGGENFCLGGALELDDGELLVAGLERPLDAQLPARILVARTKVESPSLSVVWVIREKRGLGPVTGLFAAAGQRIVVLFEEAPYSGLASIAPTGVVTVATVAAPPSLAWSHDGGLLLANDKSTAQWSSGSPAWTPKPFQLQSGVELPGRALVFFDIEPLSWPALPTGAVISFPPLADDAAYPCRRVGHWLARRLEALSRPHSAGLQDWESAGAFLTGACRGALSRRQDSGLGAMLLAELDYPASRASTQRFSLALGALAAARPPWAVAALGRAFASKRGSPPERGAALAAFVELGGDWRLAEREVTTEPADICVDAIAVAIAASPKLRAHGGALLRAARERQRCGFDSLRRASCLPSLPFEPSLAAECDRTSVSEEERWRATQRRRASIFSFGLQAALGGAAATLATVSAHDDLGRGLAVGLAGWGAFGVGYTGLLVSPCSGPLCALGEPMGIGVGVLTGVLGGAVGLLATGEPGTSRRVVAITSAAVGVGMAGIRLAQDWD